SLDAKIASGAKRIGFVKCDVEGFEPSVFKGLSKTLEQHGPIVMYESDNKGPGREAFSVLADLGYRHIYAIRETGDNSRGVLRREIQRLLSRYQFWIEKQDSVPTFWSNLLVTKTPLV